MFETFIGILAKPEETIAAEKSKASLVGGIKNFAIAGLVVGVPVGLAATIISLILAPILARLVPAGTGIELLAAFGLLAIIIVPIFAVIATVIGSLVLNLIAWAAAKISGGQGSYTLQYYLLSLLVTPLLVAFAVAFIAALVLMVVPIVGIVVGMLLLYIAMGYLSVVSTIAYVSALKAAHNFSTASAALTTGIAYALLIIVAFIVAFVLALAFGAAIFAPQGSSMMSSVLGQ